MADIAIDRERGVIERTGFRLSWGAIFAGLFVAVGLHLVLALLGVAVGFTAWDPAQPGGVRGESVATGVGIWAAWCGGRLSTGGGGAGTDRGSAGAGARGADQRDRTANRTLARGGCQHRG
jgi:hypothetical protein